MAFLSVVTTVLDGFDMAFGICIVSENAFGIGVTAVPNPTTDIGWDGWLYHKLFAIKGVETTLEGQQLAAMIRVDIDSKAMRKIKETDIMVAVVDGTEVGQATANLSFQSRVLDKLS